MSKKIRVALLFGGRSAEHEVSVRSAAAIRRNLAEDRFDVLSIYITPEGLWRPVAEPVPGPAKLATGPAFPFLPWSLRSLPGPLAADIYFPVLHGPFGEDGTIQGLLEVAGVPYVGAGVPGSALGMDKALAKSVFRERKIPVVPHMVVREKDWAADRRGVLAAVETRFETPFFVKPANLGSSVGITKVKNRREAPAALKEAFRYDAKALVEKGIAGRELECSVLGNEDPEASLPGELIPSREFYDYADKYELGRTSLIMPARLPAAVTAKVRRLAVAAFLALEVRGMARVDFFLERRTGRLYVNELNTIPGFTEISMFPKLWEVSGLPFPRLLERLIELGFERHLGRKVCLSRKA